MVELRFQPPVLGLRYSADALASPVLAAPSAWLVLVRHITWHWRARCDCHFQLSTTLDAGPMGRSSWICPQL